LSRIWAYILSQCLFNNSLNCELLSRF
jgi:hypothetical protein